MDKNFWIRKLKNFGFEYTKRSKDTPENYYLFFVYYEDWVLEVKIHEAARKGYNDLVYYYIPMIKPCWRHSEKYYLNEGLTGASEGGNEAMIDMFISKGADDWNGAMIHATKGKHKNLVKFFINKGGPDHEFNWNTGLRFAGSIGDIDLTMLYIKKGASDFNNAFRYAAENKHYKLANILKKHIE